VYRARHQPLFSQDWFDTVQEVLQADWHEARHFPQPPLSAPPLRDVTVLMCFFSFIMFSPLIRPLAKLNCGGFLCGFFVRQGNFDDNIRDV
jgi:hypothetical protein